MTDIIIRASLQCMSSILGTVVSTLTSQHLHKIIAEYRQEQGEDVTLGDQILVLTASAIVGTGISGGAYYLGNRLIENGIPFIDPRTYATDNNSSSGPDFDYTRVGTDNEGNTIYGVNSDGYIYWYYEDSSVDTSEINI